MTKSKIFIIAKKIIFKNGNIAATTTGKYLKMRLNTIASFNFNEQEWKVTYQENEPEKFEY